MLREWTVRDMFIFCVMQGPWIATTSMFASLGPVLGLFPRADPFLAILISVLTAAPTILVYAFLTSAVPRSGGEYVINSRTLHPSIAYPLVFVGNCIFMAMFCTWNAINMAVLGVGTPAYIIGAMTNSPTLMAISAWALSPTGMIIIGIPTIVVPSLMVALGMKKWAYAQRAYFVLGVISLIATIAVLLSGNPSSFAQGFSSAFPSVGHETIIPTAAKQGLDLTTGSVMGDTMAYAAYFWGVFLWTYNVVHFMGEVRGKTLRYTTAAMLGAHVFGFLTILSLVWAVFYVATEPFMKSLGYLLATGGPLVSQFPYTPYYYFFPVYLMPNALLVLLLTACFVASAVFYNGANILIATRNLFALAFDRLLPSKVAYVDRHFYTTPVAIALETIWALLWYAWATTAPSIWQFTATAIFAPFLLIMATAISAIVFPRRQKRLYEESGMSEYHIGRLPLVSLFGIVALACDVVISAYYLSIPALGAVGFTGAWYALGALYVGSFIAFWIIRAYWKQKGLDLSMLSAQLPPE